MLTIDLNSSDKHYPFYCIISEIPANSGWEFTLDKTSLIPYEYDKRLDGAYFEGMNSVEFYFKGNIF